MYNFSVLPAQAVAINGNRITTTSLIVADIFGKEHKHVLRDIDGLDCSPEFHGSNFGLMSREVQIGNGATRQDRYFEMTKDGFTFLAMGYTGPKAAQFKEAYIARFNELESSIRSGATIPANTRFLATHDGTAWWLKELPPSTCVLPVEDWPKVIKTDDFPRELLPSVLSAVSDRMREPCTPSAFDQAHIVRWIEGRNAITLADVLSAIGAPVTRRNQTIAGKCLRDNGYTPRKETVNRVRVSVYYRARVRPV